MNRRDLLSGAVTMAGVGLLQPLQAFTPRGVDVEVGFWNGERFIDPVWVPTSGARADSVTVILKRVGIPSIDRIEAVFPSSTKERRFLAWHRDGSEGVRFTMPAQRGIQLELVKGGNREMLSLHWSGRSKLAPGQYIVLPKGKRSTVSLDEDGNLQGAEGLGAVLVTIEA